MNRYVTEKSCFAASVVLVLVLGLAGSLSAATITGGSALLSQADADQIEVWIGEGSIELFNIFTQALGDGQWSVDFHAACDGQGPTVCVLGATPDGGGTTQVIGGYTPTSWASVGGIYLTPNPVDWTAFIFNLYNSTYHSQEGQHQVGHGINAGPTFGLGSDITLDNTLTTGWANGYSYGTPNPPVSGQVNIFGDSSVTYFTSYRLEVFSVVVEPVPVESSEWGAVKAMFR